MEEKELIVDVLKHYPVHFDEEKCRGYGSGHINDTYLIENSKKYILQKINTEIFKNPDQLMENISNVTNFLKNKIIENGGNPERETMTIIPTNENTLYYQDEMGNCWRMYNFVEDTISLDAVRSDEDFYQSALAFGKFQSLLSDFPAQTLHETIEKFHDTKDRFEKFKQAVQEDVMNRVKDVQEEIQFVLDREDVACVLTELSHQGKLPLRVTHNDTKLNNVLFDDKSQHGICVIDLDTVMPGLAINDFGDSIRFGASTGAEDEKDLDKIECDMHLFEVYTKGFVEGCQNKLTKEEMKCLPLGAKVMTYECGMRFLTDYLQGDVYFKTKYPTHNLDRCRTQFKLVKDMEEKWDTMNSIVEKYIQ